MSADVAAPVVDELRFPESPEKKDFTRLAKGRSEDASVVAAGALPPVRPPNEEHAATVAATAAAPANGGHVRHRAFSGSLERERKEVTFLGLGFVVSTMQIACQSDDPHIARDLGAARRSDSVP